MSTHPADELEDKDLDRLITMDEAAKMIDVDRASVLRLVRTGLLCGKKVGGRTMTSKRWILRWAVTPANYPVLAEGPPEVLETIAAYERRAQRALLRGATRLSQV